MITQISEIVHYVGVNDRTKTLFEGLWPLPNGVSYNSYLVIGEKIALIDTVEADFSNWFLRNIKEIIADRPIDYLIINHMEPDHSSSIATIRAQYPDITLAGNATTLKMVEGYYGLGGSTLEIKDGDTLSLGGATLQFILTPMLHWPETMMTYCQETQDLFSGDAFGCFGALNGAVIDKDMDVTLYWDEMYRYLSNIVGKYAASVKRAASKLSALPIRHICSTHGPIWERDIQKALDIYLSFSEFKAEPGVVIAYGSMYGNTAQTAEKIARLLAEQGIKKIAVHNLSTTPVSFVLRDIFKYKALIIGSPTYNGEVYPPVEQLLSELTLRKVQKRIFGCFGSFTWAGSARKKLMEFGETMKWDVIPANIELKQGFSQAGASADFSATLSQLVQSIANKL